MCGSMHMSTGSHSGQKKALDTLDLELYKWLWVTSVGSGNQTLVLCKNNTHS